MLQACVYVCVLYYVYVDLLCFVHTSALWGAEKMADHSRQFRPVWKASQREYHHNQYCNPILLWLSVCLLEGQWHGQGILGGPRPYGTIKHSIKAVAWNCAIPTCGIWPYHYTGTFLVVQSIHVMKQYYVGLNFSYQPTIVLYLRSLWIENVTHLIFTKVICKIVYYAMLSLLCMENWLGIDNLTIGKF